jgi:hypothetical protein
MMIVVTLRLNMLGLGVVILNVIMLSVIYAASHILWVVIHHTYKLT